MFIPKLKPHYFFALLTSVLLLSCASQKDEARLNPYLSIENVVLERVVSGIPSDYVSYRLLIEAEIYKATSIRFDRVEWGGYKGEVLQNSSRNVLSKVDIYRHYDASERITLLGNLSNIPAVALPENLQNDSMPLNNNKLYLIFYNKKGTKIRVDLGMPDEVKNFLAE